MRSTQVTVSALCTRIGSRHLGGLEDRDLVD